MNAISYFFSNLLFHNFLLSLLAFLLGLLLGWLIWARRSKGNDYSAQYEAEQKKSADLQTQLDACKKARKDLDVELGDVKGSLGSVQSDLGIAQGDASSAKSKIAELEAQLSSAKGDLNNNNSDAELATAKSRITELEAQLASAQGDLDTCRNDLGTCQADLGNCKTDLENAQSQPAPAASGGDEELRNKSMQFFAADLESGKLKKDEKYGLLYTSAVDKDEQDDLTKIHGVAGVLNKTLNDYGVYKYRQIALWTPQICEDFSERISFKGRIERDNWIDQCKQFHEEKYGEKI